MILARREMILGAGVGYSGSEGDDSGSQGDDSDKCTNSLRSAAVYPQGQGQ